MVVKKLTNSKNMYKEEAHARLGSGSLDYDVGQLAGWLCPVFKVAHMLYRNGHRWPCLLMADGHRTIKSKSIRSMMTYSPPPK